MFSAEKTKKDFPILKTKVYGKPLVYLDNAATSQKPKAVLDAIGKYYKESNANIHRGVYYLSEKATALYEGARGRAAKFIGAKDPREIIFTRGATEGLNLLASSFARTFLKKGDKVLITQGEHHSNVIPWQLNLPSVGAELLSVKLDGEGRIDMEDFRAKLDKNVKLVSVAHASNSSGVIHNVEKIIKLSREAGARVSLDACQSVPHMPVNVAKLDCDFLAFSGHKMLGPTGIGVLYGKKELLDKMEPYQGGGGMINEVHLSHSSWAEVPAKFEAGTPNIEGAIGLTAAMDYLDYLGMENISKYELYLAEMTLAVLKKNKNIQIFGPENLESRLGIISFGIKGAHPHDIATIFDEEGIAIRAGHHCAQMMMLSWGTESTARASFYLYNTEKDVEALERGIRKVEKVFNLS